MRLPHEEIRRKLPSPPPGKKLPDLRELLLRKNATKQNPLILQADHLVEERDISLTKENVTIIGDETLLTFMQQDMDIDWLCHHMKCEDIR